MQQTLDRVEKREFKLQEEQGEGRLGAEGQEGRAWEPTFTGHPASTRRCAGQLHLFHSHNTVVGVNPGLQMKTLRPTGQLATYRADQR